MLWKLDQAIIVLTVQCFVFRFASIIWRLICNKYRWINLYWILPKKTQINQHLVQCHRLVRRTIPAVSNLAQDLKELQHQKVIKVYKKMFFYCITIILWYDPINCSCHHFNKIEKWIVIVMCCDLFTVDLSSIKLPS